MGKVRHIGRGLKLAAQPLRGDAHFPLRARNVARHRMLFRVVQFVKLVGETHGRDDDPALRRWGWAAATRGGRGPHR